MCIHVLCVFSIPNSLLTEAVAQVVMVSAPRDLHVCGSRSKRKKSAAALQASPLIDSFDLTKDSDACAQLVRNTRELRGLLQDQGASGVL